LWLAISHCPAGFDNQVISTSTARSLAGYYHWFHREWMRAGLVVAVFLLVYLMVLVAPTNLVLYAMPLYAPLYMLHETKARVLGIIANVYFNVYALVGFLFIMGLPIIGLLGIERCRRRVSKVPSARL